VNISNPPLEGSKRWKMQLADRSYGLSAPLFFTQLKLRTGGGAEKSPLFFRRFRLNLRVLTIREAQTAYCGQCCGSGMSKKSRPGSGMNILAHISESLGTIFWVEILKFFDADLEIFLTMDPGSWMEKIQIPNPQHCLWIQRPLMHHNPV
jgi:hypothetical protein